MSYANAELSSQQQKLVSIARQQERMGAARHRLHATRATAGSVAMAGAGMAAAGVASGMPVLKTVRDFMRYEDSMLGIAKQVDGARDANGKLTATYYDMGRAIQNLATRVPMATTELIDLTVAGARMGIQGKENLIAFATNNAKMATAFDMPADEIGDQMGKIAGIFKIPIQHLDKLGDAINYLDDNALSKGKDIINVLQGDLAGAASTIGLPVRNAAALASTFLTLGESPERADTAASGMMRQLQIAKMNPEKFQIGAGMIGMTSTDLQMGMIKDAQGTILHVLDKINALPAELTTEAVTRLFGKDWSGAIAKLAGGVGEYRRQLELANGEAAKGSMDREFEARLDTLSAKWQLLKNKAFGFSAMAGSTLKPALTDIMDTVGRVMERLSRWIEDNPQLAGTLLKIAVVLAIVLVVLGALAIGVAAILGPFALMRFVLSALGLKGGIVIPILKGLGRAFKGIGKIMLTLGKILLRNPIILLILGIALAAYLIYKNWDPIKAWFIDLWKTVTDIFDRAWEGIKSSASAIWDWLKEKVESVSDGIVDFLSGMGNKFMDIGGAMMTGLTNGFLDGMTGLKSAIDNVAERAIGWFKDKLGIHSPSKVFATLGDYTMQGLAVGLRRSKDAPVAQVSSLAKRLTQLGTGIAIGAATLPAMAFDTRPPMASRGTSGGTVVQGDTIHITIQTAPGMDGNAIAQAVAKALDQRDRDKRARQRSSLHDY
ncbi:phage tail tape measure protein [Glaciimonas immobilis]|uniref:TP901 family phage tail tape measure protein n=1 Tax=Glaciimonas immobilis TaxID=728004 RepID=A0A840RP10_9BURK|nr:phage tail tape measure protein [Glaciimonas immobilis]KAF3999210.1 phage tail tape measure protein [Glaciimonas immobilis]MBB5198668.1 TP901 family phage tail tape measure protein [Glaciimonas immobilis]